MTTQPPDLKKLREYANGNVQMSWLWSRHTILALLDAYEAIARDAEALRAALEVEQVDLDFTIQAIVGRDPLEEIHLRVRDQKRRITDALNAGRHATQGD